MNARAFKAAWADFKLIKTRKVAQLVFEVPIEGADEALALLGGVPRPDSEVWAGIARLADGKEQSLESPQKAQETRRFLTMPMAQQAALRCQDATFRAFLREVKCTSTFNSAEAADAVRDICGVGSRAQLNTNAEAAAKWRQLNLHFELWMSAEKHGVSA